MFEINPTKVNEGRIAYDGGLTLHDLIQRLRAEWKHAEETQAYDAVEIDSKSFCIGFADGLLAELRRIGGRTHSLRA